MDSLHQIKEALRFVKYSIKTKFSRYKRYKGDDKQICRQIVDNCWNGRFFKTGGGNYNQFWTRDFGMCCESLINLGYKEKVSKTLQYALDIFEKHNRITTQITPKGYPLDFPCYTPESTAYITRCLRLLDDKKIIKKYKSFIEKKVLKAYETAFDKEKGIIRQDKHFSSMKDHYIRTSSMYNNSMIFMLSRELDKLKFNNPFKKYNFKNIHKKLFWTGEYFLDDLSKHKYVAGDANVFPFWTGNFTDKKMFQRCLKKIQENNLDKPWPLKYTRHRHKHQEMFWPALFASNYEGTTIWMHLGACFIKTVNMFDKKLAKKYLENYKKAIEKHQNFLEVFNTDGTIYKKSFYTSDESMLWASIYLELVR